MRAGGTPAGQTAYLRRRLIVALVFFIPLTDLSLVLSLMPWAPVPRLAVGAGRLRGAGGSCGAPGPSTGPR